MLVSCCEVLMKQDTRGMLQNTDDSDSDDLIRFFLSNQS